MTFRWTWTRLWFLWSHCMFTLLRIIKAAYRRYKKTFENLENGKYKDCKNSTIIHSNYTPFLAQHLKVCVGVAGGGEMFRLQKSANRPHGGKSVQCGQTKLDHYSKTTRLKDHYWLYGSNTSFCTQHWMLLLKCTFLHTGAVVIIAASQQQGCELNPIFACFPFAWVLPRFPTVYIHAHIG